MRDKILKKREIIQTIFFIIGAAIVLFIPLDSNWKIYGLVILFSTNTVLSAQDLVGDIKNKNIALYPILSVAANVLLLVSVYVETITRGCIIA